MRILYILSGTEIRGGATKSFLAMADSVVAAGHQVAVVVPDENGVTPVLKSKGWEVLVVPYMFATLPYLSWALRDMVKFVPRLVKSKTLNRKARKIVDEFAEKWRPDIVHDNTSVTDLGYYVGQKLNIPHLIHIREYGWRDFHRINPGLKRRLSDPNAYVATITADLASFRGKGIKNSHLRVIYNGVVSGIPSGYNPAKAPYFLYAGRIREAKGVGDLIAAYVAYASTEIGAGRVPLGLKLAGALDTGEFMDKVRGQIKDAGIDDYVEWLGERDDVGSFYSVAAATVIPSRAEGFGRVMPEAMAAGSLCIARNEGGLAEQLDNGRRECGKDIAFGYETVDELTAILTQISDAYREGGCYNEGGRFFRMIADSRDVTCRLYSYEANARGILNYYSEIHNADRTDRK
ncbi:MAG: glycosyltransferase [Muribaculaceae bacterium]|nr:glycosyltransferase [Muribaculaceae bacterium]